MEITFQFRNNSKRNQVRVKINPEQAGVMLWIRTVVRGTNRIGYVVLETKVPVGPNAVPSRVIAVGPDGQIRLADWAMVSIPLPDETVRKIVKRARPVANCMPHAGIGWGTIPVRRQQQVPWNR